MGLHRTNKYKKKQNCSGWTWFIWRKKKLHPFPKLFSNYLRIFFLSSQFLRKISFWFSVLLIKKLQTKDKIAKSSNGIVFFFCHFLETKLKMPRKVCYRIGKYGKKLAHFPRTFHSNMTLQANCLKNRNKKNNN